MESRVDNPRKYIVLSCATNIKPIDRPTNLVWPGPSTGCDARNGSLSVGKYGVFTY